MGLLFFFFFVQAVLCHAESTLYTIQLISSYVSIPYLHWVEKSLLAPKFLCLAFSPLHCFVRHSGCSVKHNIFKMSCVLATDWDLRWYVCKLSIARLMMSWFRALTWHILWTHCFRQIRLAIRNQAYYFCGTISRNLILYSHIQNIFWILISNTPLP